MKPGGNLVAFGASRTYHRLAVAVEDAGFEIRGFILAWTYSQGVPKSLELSTSLVRVGAPELAEKFQGFETQLKPSFEPMVFARKRMTTSLTRNLIDYGVGGLNIDAIRIPTDEDTGRRPGDTVVSTFTMLRGTERSETHAGGRWPTNTLITHHPLCEEDGDCCQMCMIADLNTMGKPYTGDKSRYYSVFRYESKARGAERPSGPGVRDHATTKPLKLMDWLVQLIAAPGQVILDPFLGSGTTAEACIRNGVRVIGIEMDPANLPAIEFRIDRANAA